jgi:exoribonuclease R
MIPLVVLHDVILWFRSSSKALPGKVGDKATENQVLLLEHDIPHSSFSEAVLECLPTLPWEITRKVGTVLLAFE